MTGHGMYIFSIILLALVAWLLWEMNKAPEGYEDATGFHYGKPKRQGDRSMLLVLIRDVSVDECPWLDCAMKKGELVFEYTGPTYGCIAPTGLACSKEKNVSPFFELPGDAVRPIGD